MYKHSSDVPVLCSSTSQTLFPSTRHPLTLVLLASRHRGAGKPGRRKGMMKKPGAVNELKNPTSIKCQVPHLLHSLKTPLDQGASI